MARASFATSPREPLDSAVRMASVTVFASAAGPATTRARVSASRSHVQASLA